MSTLSKIIMQVLRTGESHTLTQAEREAWNNEHWDAISPSIRAIRKAQREAFNAAQGVYLD